MQLALKQLADLVPADTGVTPGIFLSIAPGTSLVLENVDWQAFEKLLLDLGETRAARIAYDRGTLEIMAPLPRHEYFKEAVGILVQDLADELDLNYESLGSTTWKRQDILGSVEPDNCFYFQNEPLIRGKLDLDLGQEPPPDLALEIDITSKSLDRMAIYARLGVPEVWRYENGILKIYQLQAQQYLEANTSLAFPMFPVQEIIPFINQHLPLGKKAMRRTFRTWVRQRMSTPEAPPTPDIT
jgi:Uma2 family endonuclease